MTEVTIEVLSQRQAVLDHQIINRTTTINVIITEQMITIIMLVCQTATQDRHMLVFTVFKHKKMTFSHGHGQMLIHKDTGMRQSIRYHSSVSVFIKRQQ